MSRTQHRSAHRSLSSKRFWRWRDLHREQVAAHAEDAELAEAFRLRVLELKESVEFLLNGGLNDGAVEALGAIAEQDMADFCILMDLADPHIADRYGGVEATSQQALAQFMQLEPWRSLAVDNDLTIALALLDEVSSLHVDRPWYTHAPTLAAVTGRALDAADADQIARFVGEFNALAERDGLQLPDGFEAVLDSQLTQAANRLGLPTPKLKA